MARLRGCSRSTVSRACLPGGALHPALIAGTDRVDASHPAHRAFVGPVSRPIVYGLPLTEAIAVGLIEPEPQPVAILDPERVISFERLAEMMGLPLSEVPALRVQLAEAIPVDIDHPTVRAFLAEQGVTF